eukprot:2067955-Pyramimonas_sp.AAC.1
MPVTVTVAVAVTQPPSQSATVSQSHSRGHSQSQSQSQSPLVFYGVRTLRTKADDVSDSAGRGKVGSSVAKGVGVVSAVVVQAAMSMRNVSASERVAWTFST